MANTGSTTPPTAAKPANKSEPATTARKAEVSESLQAGGREHASMNTGGLGHKAEAKSHFNAALDEAKAGAAALKAEAGVRADEYRTRAKGKGEELKGDARVYGDKARGKAGEMAVEGKGKASEALAALSRMVSDNANKLDENFGAQYGDYARSAARNLQESADKLEQKSVEELGEDAREFDRTKPGTAVGIAAVGGFLLARLYGVGR